MLTRWAGRRDNGCSALQTPDWLQRPRRQLGETAQNSDASPKRSEVDVQVQARCSLF